jgi:uncharacterized protein
MPENLPLGVYIDELNFRRNPIVGVSTSICAFIGPTLEGPVGVVSPVLSSFAHYTQIYGGIDNLAFAGNVDALYCRNYIAHAVQAFVSNGGQQLYIVRVASGLHGDAGSFAPQADGYVAALLALDQVADVSTVAAPGYSAFASLDDGAVYRAIQSALLAHVAGPRRFLFAVLDSPPHASVEQIKLVRGGINSSYAALYYPWVIAANPLADTSDSEPTKIALPPSGFVCGIYARVDTERAVFKAPANEAITGAIGFDVDLNSNHIAILNPLGICCSRFFEGRGYRLWGGRTTSNDPEYKYVNIRRYLSFLESSIDRGMQWAVFEPNGEKLWLNARSTVQDFLYNEWRNGALAGSKPEHAFFVRCERTTMTQNDLDHGKLVMMIGVATIRPAEFIVLRIVLTTADTTPGVNP